MDYTDNSVSKIAIEYLQLKDSLRELRETRKEGAVLAYFADTYKKAESAINFLLKIPSGLQNELEIGKLERELMNFANIHIEI